jgi:Tfp pilus assembly pilus retraction ATPase PilT
MAVVAIEPAIEYVLEQARSLSAQNRVALHGLEVAVW